MFFLEDKWRKMVFAFAVWCDVAVCHEELVRRCCSCCLLQCFLAILFTVILQFSSCQRFSFAATLPSFLTSFFPVSSPPLSLSLFSACFCSSPHVFSRLTVNKTRLSRLLSRSNPGPAPVQPGTPRAERGTGNGRGSNERNEKRKKRRTGARRLREEENKAERKWEED